MIIENAKSYNQCFGAHDLYIFAIGYEERSYYLYDHVLEKFPASQPIVFVFDDYTKYTHSALKVRELEKRGITPYVKRYDDSIDVQKIIIEAIGIYISQKETVTIHIDYSSMPRSWYCKLPKMIEKIIRYNDRVFFWYAEGTYPTSYEEYPSAGIDAFSFFSGKPSLKIDNTRIHVLALGYDVIRTQAILSITDPGYLVACYAYNPERKGFSESLELVNENIFSHAAIKIALHIDDFEFMVSKLCETANELLPTGDIILIPDGPKPLIFALSLVPELINKNGISCLHISRNSDHFEAVNVIATGKVFGFTIHMDS